MKKSNPGLYAIVLLLALLGLAYYGGLPAPDEMPFFILGSVILVGLSLLIGALGWFLLYRPLPENYKIRTESPLKPFQRQLLGSTLIMSMVLVGLGGVWDEVWHTLYGIPFGEDFFWRPHMLIYAGFIILILLAGLSILVLLRNGKGNLSQRFRADPFIAFTVLVGLYMVYALPADPIWHSIYGEDLTSFSIPHVLLTVMFTLPFLIGTGFIISSNPKSHWRSILSFRLTDTLPILAFVFIQLITFVLFVVNWEVLAISSNMTIALLFPEWLFPLLLSFSVVFVGISATHSLRYYGAATLIGVLSFGLRLLLLRLLGHELQSANAWLIALVVHLCIDAFYFLRRGNIPGWWQAGLFAGLGMSIISLPLINSFYPTPETTISNLPFMLLACFAGALLAAWFAQALGDFIADSPRYISEEVPKMRLLAVSGAIFAATLLFFLWFVMTATPPVA